MAIDNPKLIGKIMVLSEDGRQAVRPAIEHEGATWFVATFHPHSDAATGWPATIVRPPQDQIEKAEPGLPIQYLLKCPAPKSALSLDSRSGKHGAFEVRRLPPPPARALN